MKTFPYELLNEYKFTITKNRYRRFYLIAEGKISLDESNKLSQKFLGHVVNFYGKKSLGWVCGIIFDTAKGYSVSLMPEYVDELLSTRKIINFLNEIFESPKSGKKYLKKIIGVIEVHSNKSALS